MLFDNRWNQHTCTSLTLLPFGLWAPGISKHKIVKSCWQLTSGSGYSTGALKAKINFIKIITIMYIVLWCS